MAGIDYQKLMDEAMFGVVKKILEKSMGYIKKYGELPYDHHFYITFLTNHPDVKIPEFLKKQYPNEITIVIQHQFEDLTVSKTGFEVTLSFQGKQERICVPFDAFTSFADPSKSFGLQFKEPSESSFDDEISSSFEEAMERASQKSDEPKTSKNSNVIDLEDFRKK